MDACDHVAATNRVTYEWALIEAPMTSPRAVTAPLKSRLHVNLISLNQPGFSGKPAKQDTAARFLEIPGQPALQLALRLRRGIDINAAAASSRRPSATLSSRISESARDIIALMDNLFSKWMSGLERPAK